MTRERRQFSRAAQPFEVKYHLFGDLTASWNAVASLNLSAGGIRFRCPELLEVGDILELRILLPGLREPLVLKGHVAWSHAAASGVAETGVEFMDVTLDQQVQIDGLVQFLRKETPRADPPS